MQHLAYLGTDSVRGSQGIYTVALDSDSGNLTLKGTVPALNSGYITRSVDGKMLYAAVESMVMDGRACGGVGVYKIGDDGLPYFVNRLPADGQLICHISCDEKFVYASSYLAGTVTIYPIAEDGTLKEYCKVIRHSGKDGYAPHIHCAKPTADGKYLCVVEVGYHAVCLYDKVNFEKQYEIRTKPVRPRQIVSTEKCIYLITEGGMTVDEYAYTPDAEEKLVLRQSLSCNPDGFRGMGGSGGIRMSPDGKYIFGAIRGVDVIAVFAVDENGSLTKKSVTKMCGSTPRDFNVSPDGKYLLVGLQKSDCMAVYRFVAETAELELVVENFAVPSCSCVEF